MQLHPEFVLEDLGPMHNAHTMETDISQTEPHIQLCCKQFRSACGGQTRIHFQPVAPI